MPRSRSTAQAMALKMALKMALAVALALQLGCAGGLLPPPGVRARAERGDIGAAAPWEIGADAFPSQRLYRVQYSGPEGDLSFKLILYLESRERFRMQAADALGRKLWVLRVADPRQALWLNHRERTFCWADPATGLSFVPLTRLPLAAFPRLLLGRLPASPAADLRRAEGQLSYLDARGRTWVGTLDGDAPARWSLLEGDRPVAWWQRVGDPGDGSGDDKARRPEALFSDRVGQQQVRWKEVVSEPLGTALAADPIPDGYREETCAVTAI